MSQDPGVWVAALLTFFVLSFLVRDNPLFRFAEHLFVGVSSGYVFVLQWRNIIRPNLVERAMDGSLEWSERALLVVPLFLGLCMLARAVPRIASFSRLASAFIVGFVVGTNLPQQLKTQILDQVATTVEKRVLGSPLELQTFNHLVFVAGTVSVLLYFLFSVPRAPRVRRAMLRTGSLGRYFLMVAFGATFGNTVMARVSILIGRVQFLLQDCFGWVE